MSSEHYGRERLKRSLAQFLAGKVLGLTIGFTWMLVLVRAMLPADYGVYIAFTGIGEMLILMLSFGIPHIIDRYIPDRRIAGDGRGLRALALIGVASRLAAMALGCVIIGAFAHQLMPALGLAGKEVALYWYLLAATCEGTGRCIESFFDALLLQGRSQASLLLRYGSRTVVLTSLWATGQTVTLDMWCRAEALCYFVTLLVSIGMLLHTARLQQSAGHQPGQPLQWGRYLDYALPTYLSDLSVLVSSIDTSKVIAARLFGAGFAAVFGFCISISWMLMRYLPTYLLVGVLRPMFVAAAHAADPGRRLRLLFDLVVKLNIFVMVPAIAVTAQHGDTLIAALSGQRFTGGGLVFCLLMLLVLTQAVRASLMLLISVYEDGQARLTSTWLGNLVFAAGTLAALRLGPAVFVLSLSLADAAASAQLLRRIRRQGLVLHMPIGALAKTALSGAFASFAMSLALRGGPAVASLLSVLAAGACAALAYLLAAAILKPFASEERDIVNSLIPRKLFIW